jgi:hypothetical protein
MQFALEVLSSTMRERERSLYWINSKEAPLASVTAGGLAMSLLPCTMKHFPGSIAGKASLHIGHSFCSLASLHSVQSLLLHHGQTYLNRIKLDVVDIEPGSFASSLPHCQQLWS